jgi:hypothetical protein
MKEQRSINTKVGNMPMYRANELRNIRKMLFIFPIFPFFLFSGINFNHQKKKKKNFVQEKKNCA